MSDMAFHCFDKLISLIVDTGKYICGEERQKRGTANSRRITSRHPVRSSKQNIMTEAAIDRLQAHWGTICTRSGDLLPEQH